MGDLSPRWSFFSKHFQGPVNRLLIGDLSKFSHIHLYLRNSTLASSCKFKHVCSTLWSGQLLHALTLYALRSLQSLVASCTIRPAAKNVPHISPEASLNLAPLEPSSS